MCKGIRWRWGKKGFKLGGEGATVEEVKGKWIMMEQAAKDSASNQNLAMAAGGCKWTPHSFCKVSLLLV